MASHGLAASNVPITQSHQPLQRYILVPGAVQQVAWDSRGFPHLLPPPPPPLLMVDVQHVVATEQRKTC
jgi:hypothetical protein